MANRNAAPFTVLHVVGARPNFMKVAPVLRALEARPGFRNVLVHTGQCCSAMAGVLIFGTP